MYFDSISHEKPIATNDHTLPIRKPLLHALRQVLFYLETGLLCRHMHILKQQEIILILRGFYAKNELAGFFAGASGMGSKFEDLILNNYRKVKTVKELPVCAAFRNAPSTGSSSTISTKAPISGCRNGKPNLSTRKSVTRISLSGK